MMENTGKRWMSAGCLAIAMTLSFSGCTGKLKGSDKVEDSTLIIPDFPTAREQFNYAKAYQGSMFISPDKAKRRSQLTKIGQCYGKVITNFPNDSLYVSLTYLELGDCAAQGEEWKQSIEFYQQAAATSADEFIQARSQFSIARVYSAESKHQEAKQMYKAIMDQYGKSQSGKVMDVVKRSAGYYYKIIDPAKSNASKKPVNQDPVLRLY